MVSQLDYLRSRSKVDCDTLDVEVAKALGPFIDCTSNQVGAPSLSAMIDSDRFKAIAAGELLKQDHERLIEDSAKLAIELGHKYAEVTAEELAVEIMMVKLSMLFAPHITGFVHTQTNPRYARSYEKTIANGRRIAELYEHLKPGMKTRVCIKIPSTWEGLHACGVLEKENIATLATTLFTIEQAALAADQGATYIAPYVNELKVHVVPGYVDQKKAFDVCAESQLYFRRYKARTQCLPARYGYFPV